MSAPSHWAGSLAGLADGSIGSMLVAKWTLLLALAWLAHAALAGRNPRWRVALWRGAMLGVGLIVAFAHVPPIVSVPDRSSFAAAHGRRRRRRPTGVVSPPVPPRTMRTGLDRSGCPDGAQPAARPRYVAGPSRCRHPRRR